MNLHISLLLHTHICILAAYITFHAVNDDSSAPLVMPEVCVGCSDTISPPAARFNQQATSGQLSQPEVAQQLYSIQDCRAE